MIPRKLSFAIPVVALLISSPAMSQNPGTEQPAGRFVGAPEVGERIPDVTIVDDRGNPVNVRELVGRSPYTVLTLGCLT